jgi:hypothetical protein
MKRHANTIGNRQKILTISIVVTDLRSLLANQQLKQLVVRAKKSMTDIVTYPKDNALKTYLLTNDRLMLLEMIHPGAIRLRASGRYHARLEIFDRGYTFRLREIGLDGFDILDNFLCEDTTLRELVLHRAAEAMFAHRKGNHDAVLDKKLRRSKTEQDV